MTGSRIKKSKKKKKSACVRVCVFYFILFGWFLFLFLCYYCIVLVFTSLLWTGSTVRPRFGSPLSVFSRTSLQASHREAGTETQAHSDTQPNASENDSEMLNDKNKLQYNSTFTYAARFATLSLSLSFFTLSLYPPPPTPSSPPLSFILFSISSAVSVTAHVRKFRLQPIPTTWV